MTRTSWIIAGGFVVGIFYSWFNEYNSLEAGGINVKTLMMTASSILAFLLVYLEYHALLKTALFIAAGVALAIVCRIVFDTTFTDKTLHNLAPFEILIGSGLSFFTAIVGGALGALARKAAGPSKES